MYISIIKMNEIVIHKFRDKIDIYQVANYINFKNNISEYIKFIGINKNSLIYETNNNYIIITKYKNNFTVSIGYIFNDRLSYDIIFGKIICISLIDIYNAFCNAYSTINMC
jgi:hypothetical protein